MAVSVDEAKLRLDYIVEIARVHFYKPIHIAEVLYRSRTVGDIDPGHLSTYQNPSVRWRDEVTMRLVGKRSTSSMRYQHDVWSETAMPPEILQVLDRENKETGGAVERYIYVRFNERQSVVAQVFATVAVADPSKLDIAEVLALFRRERGIRRSIDKAYEIVAFCLFDTVIQALDAQVAVSVPANKTELLSEFAEIGELVLGITSANREWSGPARIFRVGVTNAADRGLDMWANFGPAIQVKHLVLDPVLAERIVDQVESDNIVVVCRDADRPAVEAVTKQIGWGRRVRAIITEGQLCSWYERCLRGHFAADLGRPLLDCLRAGFEGEFPTLAVGAAFLAERSYDRLTPPSRWRTALETR